MSITTKKNKSEWKGPDDAYWDGDMRKSISLEKSGGMYQIVLAGYRAYEDFDGVTRYTRVGKRYKVLTIVMVFGKIYFEFNKGHFESHGFKKWMRDCVHSIKPFRVFLKRHWSLDLEDLVWSGSWDPTNHESCVEDADWVEELEHKPFVSLESQCVEPKKNIERILSAMAHLEDGGYEDLVTHLDMSLRNARRRLVEVLEFDKVDMWTDPKEIPKWALSYDIKRECKQKRATIAKDFKDVLGDF